MAGKPKVSQEERQRVIDLYKAGHTLRDLEKSLHHDRKWMAKLITTAGVKIRDNTINSRKYHHNENYFESIDTEEKAYWLGFIYADSYIQPFGAGDDITRSPALGISLAAEDKEHLEKFKACIEADNKITSITGSGYNPNGDFVRVQLTSRKMCDDLISKGVVKNKTLIVTYPDHSIVPDNLERHFVRGYMDGDGTISYWVRNGVIKDSKNFLLGFTGTYDFLCGIKSYFGKDNLAIQPSHNAYQINIGGNQQLRSILPMLYDDAHIYLERKHDIYLDYLKYVERQG